MNKNRQTQGFRPLTGINFIIITCYVYIIQYYTRVFPSPYGD